MVVDTILETIESHNPMGAVDGDKTVSLTDYQFLSSYQ